MTRNLYLIPHLPAGNPPSVPVSVSLPLFCLFCAQVPHVSEVVWHLSVSDLLPSACCPLGPSMRRFHSFSSFFLLSNIPLCVCVCVSHLFYFFLFWLEYFICVLSYCHFINCFLIFSQFLSHSLLGVWMTFYSVAFQFLFISVRPLWGFDVWSLCASDTASCVHSSGV